MTRKIKFCLIFLFATFSVFAQNSEVNPEIQPEVKRPKVGLVLSGGGAKGFAYIGLF
jgi:NTE family protein